jgi:hypothetical protein
MELLPAPGRPLITISMVGTLSYGSDRPFDAEEGRSMVVDPHRDVQPVHVAVTPTSL